MKPSGPDTLFGYSSLKTLSTYSTVLSMFCFFLRVFLKTLLELVVIFSIVLEMLSILRSVFYIFGSG